MVMTYSTGFLAIGAVLVIVAAWRLYACRDCVSRRDLRAPARPDAGSVWVSVGLLGLAATVFIAGGLRALIQ